MNLRNQQKPQHTEAEILDSQIAAAERLVAMSPDDMAAKNGLQALREKRAAMNGKVTP